MLRIILARFRFCVHYNNWVCFTTYHMNRTRSKYAYQEYQRMLHQGQRLAAGDHDKLSF